MTFLYPRSSWRRDYLERIKIITNKASLGLGLTHNELSSEKMNSLLPRVRRASGGDAWGIKMQCSEHRESSHKASGGDTQCTKHRELMHGASEFNAQGVRKASDVT
ncbi:unnamed protein product [Spirodela intermedia]|uniref:Uncharacterized protein n=1 Tax=Spirodela intermedia TaxID=51605 RepID=A0A7I8L7Y8_SPIIN|nr:unnamed protein product [Spirodela intermedia]